MLREFRDPLLKTQSLLLVLNHDPVDYKHTHVDPKIEARLAANRQSGAQPSTKLGGDAPPEEPEDPISKIPRAPDVPGLDSLLYEYADVFPADLPTELPVKREFDMLIPIKPGSAPTNQQPYRISAEAQETVRATLDYLYSHCLAQDSTSEYAAPITLAPKPDGTWRFCIDY
eukprot:343774-Rhodomonas_salina.2